MHQDKQSKGLKDMTGPPGNSQMLTRHGICHGCTDIICVNFIFTGVRFCCKHTLFLTKFTSFCFVVVFLVMFLSPLDVKGGKTGGLMCRLDYIRETLE